MRKSVSAIAAIGLFIASASFACAQTKGTTCVGLVEPAPDGKEGWYDILGGDYACVFNGKSAVGKAILSVCPVGTTRCKIEAIGERTPNFHIERIRSVELLLN
jgi:hypothetical protein